VKVFYHGISSDVIFESTSFCVHGPMSTTSEYLIAHSSFAKDGGTVVEINNGQGGQYLIPAQYWSDFTEEREYLFIGGLQIFEFISIHDMALQLDYAPFIVPISAMVAMLTGWMFTVRALTKMDLTALRCLISDRLSISESKTALTPYLRRLFANITHNFKPTIEINTMSMEGREYQGSFGFKHFHPLFLAQYGDCKTCSCKTIDFPMLLRLFGRTLESVVVYYTAGKQFERSLMLNNSFVNALFAAFDVVSASFRLRQRFKSFIIVEPSIKDIGHFIEQNQTAFMEKGWAMKKGTYKHLSRGISSDNALIISQM